jgi:hypothetical protein
MAEAAVTAGALSVDVLKSADPAAYTLLRGTIALTPESQSPKQYPTPVVHRAESSYTPQQNLERLMAQAISMRRRG